MEHDVNITLSKELPEVKFLHITREDEAKPWIEPVKADFTGDIHTVANYLSIEDKKATVKPVNAVIVIDHKNGIITLEVDKSDKYAPKITGALRPNAKLEKLTINGDHEYSLAQLREKLKWVKPLFASPSVHEKLMSVLASTNIKMERAEHQANDETGNQSASVDIKSTIPEDLKGAFTLNTPLFEGEDNVKFDIKLAFLADGRKLTCWFESVELRDLRESEMKRIMDAEKAKFTDYVIVNQF